MVRRAATVRDRSALWLAAPPGVQDHLIQTDPQRYFRPPYVGHRGWVGAYLDVDIDWVELESFVGLAWLTRATPAIRRRAEGRP